MRRVLNRRNDLLVTLGLLVVNALFVANLLGVSYGHFSWEAYAGTYVGEGGTAATCSDGLDNNLNNLIDCADPACASVEPCLAKAPVTSLPGLVSLGVVLASVGILAMRRRPND